MMKIVKALLFVVLIMSVSSDVLAGYQLEPTWEYTTIGGGTWGAVLRMEGEVYGSAITFTVHPIERPGDGHYFTSSGKIHLKVGTYESWGVDRYCGPYGNPQNVNIGDPEKTFTHNLNDYSLGNYTPNPEKFYVRYEADGGGVAWVGPIKVHYYEYSWYEGSWSSCDSNCQQTHSVHCKRNDGEEVSDSKCSDNKPDTQRDCTRSWETGNWNPCDRDCEQTRNVSCECSNGNEISDWKCSGTKPNTKQSCNGGSCTYSWEYGDWSTCDSNCEKTRDARCERSDGQTASDRDCSGSKDDTQRDCTGGDCTYSWEYGDWTTCDSNCEKTRDARCERSDGQTASDGECSGTKEETQQDCTGGDCPSYTYSWKYGDWTACDSNCEKTRDARCERSDGQTASDGECSGTKDEIRRECSEGDCPGEEIQGDINGDKNLNIFDLQILINVIRKTETDPGRVSRADLNEDSKVNVFDLQRLINLIRGNIRSSRSTRSERDPTEGNTLTLPDIQVKQNDTGHFALSLSNEDAVASGEIKFTYDASCGFDLTDMKPTSRADGFFPIFEKDDSDPANVEIMVLFYSTEGLTIPPGSGEILKFSYVTGTAAGSESTALTFKEAFLSDLNADPLQVNTRSGEILFDAAFPEEANVLTLPDIQVKQNDTGHFALSLSNEDAVASGEIKFTYDASCGFDLTDMKPTSRADGFFPIFEKDDSDPANVEIMVLFYSTEGLTIPPGSGEILKFSYVTGTAAGSESTALTFKEALLSDLNADSLEVGTLDGKVSFESDPSTDTDTIPGDINRSGVADLDDAIIAMQICAGMTPSSNIYTDADVNNDDRIGLEEAIFALKVVAGLIILPGNYGDLGIPDDYEQTLISFRDSFPDAADYQSAITQLPESFDWRNKGVVTRAKDERNITPADNQGRCGSCWAFAAVGAFESKILMAGGPEYDISEQQQISCNDDDQYGCCGGFLNAALFWRDRGPVEENCTGYDDFDTTRSSCGCRDFSPYIHCSDVFCDSMNTCASLPYRTTDTYYSLDAADRNEVKISLRNDGPAPFRFDTYEDFADFWNGGIFGEVYKYSIPSERKGGHAVLLIGWDDAKEAWLCKNSWGEEGPNGDGTFWIAYSDHVTDLRFGMANFTIKNEGHVTTSTTTSSTSTTTSTTSTTTTVSTTSTSTTTTTTTIVIDPPKVSGLSSDQTLTMGESYTLRGTVSADDGDRLTKVTAAVNGPGFEEGNNSAMTSGPISESSFDLSNFTFRTSIFDEPGTYTIGIWAITREYPASEAIEWFYITVDEPADTTDPTGFISGIGSSYTAGDTVSYTVKGWDNRELSKLHFMVRNHNDSEMHDKEWYVSGTSAEKSYSFQTSGWNSGTYYYALWVMDAAGNTEDYTGSFEIEPSYAVDTTSTTDGDGTWGAILRLRASISGTDLTLTVTTKDGTAWKSSGNMYFKVGSPESYGHNRETVSMYVGRTSASYTHDLTDYAGDYPKEFYARYEPDAGGYAWVGPITVTED